MYKYNYLEPLLTMKKMLRGGMLALTCATAICAAAQSIYPGSADALLKVKNVPEMKAQAFPLSAVRLLPGRLHDNLSRDSAWMANISTKRLLHSFRNTP